MDGRQSVGLSLLLYPSLKAEVWILMFRAVPPPYVIHGGSTRLACKMVFLHLTRVCAAVCLGFLV